MHPAETINEMLNETGLLAHGRMTLRQNHAGELITECEGRQVFAPIELVPWKAAPSDSTLYPRLNNQL